MICNDTNAGRCSLQTVDSKHTCGCSLCKSCNVFVCLEVFIKKKTSGDFPGGTADKTPCSQCRGPGFNPWSGN